MTRLLEIPGGESSIYNITIDMDKIVYATKPVNKKYSITMVDGTVFTIQDDDFWPNKRLPYEKFIELWEGQ
jgi:hypothetical protein